jgi:hypothetical protein
MRGWPTLHTGIVAKNASHTFQESRRSMLSGEEARSICSAVQRGWTSGPNVLDPLAVCGGSCCKAEVTPMGIRRDLMTFRRRISLFEMFQFRRR